MDCISHRELKLALYAMNLGSGGLILSKFSMSIAES